MGIKAILKIGDLMKFKMFSDCEVNCELRQLNKQKGWK